VRAVVQRVRAASVTVGDETVGSIGRGFCVLLGVETGDTPERAKALAARIAKLRIFDDAAGKMNLALAEVGGEVLLVSQFTLLGECSGGNRPSFVRAARPEEAEPLYGLVRGELERSGLRVATGRFRTAMLVRIENEGPVTILLEA
jgi:D-tyrosyl-tRNA(Tyr) deacylase